MVASLTPVAVYVHCPFCPSKCGYCDFNSFALSGDIVQRTAEAMRAEIARSPWRGRPAKTIFFGGGTPTYFPADVLAGLLDAVRASHPPVDGCEITSEANPGTVDAERFAAMRAAGFNRVSIGAQSFQAGDLVRLGRVHGADEVPRAVAAARSAGISNLNLDLMFGLPGQTPETWQRNLDIALALRPEHLSLYGLTIEPNTRFARLHRRGMLHLPDEDALVVMYDAAVSACERAGLRQYEISNFARPGCECRHNLCYWRAEEYLGYGPGAVGCVAEDGVRRRTTNVKHPERYCEAVAGGAPLACEEERLDEATLATERAMLGLRLNEGLARESVPSPGGLPGVVAAGWVEDLGQRIRLTAAGRHLCTEVAARLI